jgi:two-component system cell cycle sensor histidine kinase/response regulator CckA
MTKSAQTERAADRSHLETDRRVLQIANRVSATIGIEFFHSMVEHLAEVLQADCVYIGEFLGGQTERVKTLAVCPELPDGFEHELAGSASAQVALGKPCLCRAHARGRYPDDPLLARLGAEACVGVPLLNSGGHSLGLMMTVYRSPIADPDIPMTILEAFADRAAAELERKQRGEQLRQSEERHRAFVALNPDALWRIEFEPPVPTSLTEQEQLERIYLDGYLAECNDALARLLGAKTVKELIGRPIRELERLSNPSVRNATLHAIRSGYRFGTVETGPFGRDEKPRYMLRSQWGIVEDGLLRRLWGCTREITELKLSELAFDASEQRMLHLMENLPLMVVMLHPDGQIAFCNDHLLEFTGWRLADVLEKNWVDLMIPAAERGRVRAAIAATNTEPRRPVHFESPLLGSAGVHCWTAWDSTSLRDAEGKNAMTANLGTDITDFKHLEAQFQQAQKLESVGRLAGGLARDFNKLLTVIGNCNEQLLAKSNPLDGAYIGLSEIRRAAEKGVGLTQRLLAFSGQPGLRPEILNLNTLIAQDERMLRQLIGERIELVTNLDSSLDAVHADAGQVHQIVLNLVMNARDAMPHGGTLTISTSNLDIVACATAIPGVKPGSYVQLTVADTGTGMSEEVSNHVFEPFYTTKEPGKGTGLGLSTVYGLVQQGGGHIVFESAPGHGTLFKILLPVLDQSNQSKT